MSRWKRPLVALVLVISLAALVAACGGSSSDTGSSESTSAEESTGGGEEASGSNTEPLVIGGWGGAIDEGTQKHYIDKYQEEGGPSDITFVDAPGTQLARVEAQNQTGNIEWDLIDSAPGTDAYVMASKGLLAPLPADLKQELTDELGKDRVTDFGFSHANIGHVIVCNMDKMDTCPKTMAEFFDAEKFPQSRTLGATTPLITATAAEEAAGVASSETATTPLDLDSVFEVLDGVRSKVRVFFESGDQQLQIMRNGEAEMGLLWSGRAYTLLDEGMNLQINWDESVYEPSYWTAVKGAPNLEGAFQFMKWMAENPEAQAEWSKELNYSVPNPEAFDFLSEKDAKRQADYPANFEVMAIPNWEWYAEPDNQAELDSRYQDYLRG